MSRVSEFSYNDEKTDLDSGKMTWAQLVRNSPGRHLENDEMTTLLGGNLTRGTPWRQHDNPLLRLPTQFLRWLWFSFLDIATSVFDAIQSVWYFVLSLTLDILSFIDRHMLGICHLLFAATLIGLGVPLGMSISHDELRIGLLLIEAAITIVWAVFSRFVEFRRSSSI